MTSIPLPHQQAISRLQSLDHRIKTFQLLTHANAYILGSALASGHTQNLSAGPFETHTRGGNKQLVAVAADYGGDFPG